MNLIKETNINTNNAVACIILLFAYVFLFTYVQSQEKKRGQAFRDYAEPYIPFVIPSSTDIQLLEAFTVLQKANAGDISAQHELGLRYLMGKGFAADTNKAAYWISKSANQKLPLAQYNYGILLMNGYGVEWSPFEAFEYISASAEYNIPEALYMMGILYVDNFTVARNWQKAHQYLTKSAELGFEPAKYSLRKMEEYGLNKINDTNKISSAPPDTGFSLLFIDFDVDTSSKVEDTILVKKVYELKERSFGKGVSSSSKAVNYKSHIDSDAQTFLNQAANIGIPEALCLLGRCFELGVNVNKNRILACMNYLHASHLDSYQAPKLIWRLVQTEGFVKELEEKAAKKEPDALYVLSGLTLAGYVNILSESQAIDLLKRAAEKEHTISIIELGSFYFTGRSVIQDRNKALELWRKAAMQGSVEASIRIAAANALNQIHTIQKDSAFSFLIEYANKGSLLSDLTLAYCYEKGINIGKNKGEAYRIYHKSLIRGSQSAYYAIRRMHDEIRPNDRKFKMID